MLGKRKRELVIAPRQTPPKSPKQEESGDDSPSGNNDVFRRYFESAFEPLPFTETDTLSASEDEEPSAQPSDEESDWEGLSDPITAVSTVQIVEHKVAQLDDAADDEQQRQRYKEFMTSKPPSQKKQGAKGAIPGKRSEQDDDESEAINLKHDLDLQRLLKESHLLEQAKASSLPGTHRHKAVDMRMQALGSKDSLFTQQKMPLSHRRGIAAKAVSQEALRRREAKESGIVLEKATGKNKSSGVRRDRGVDVPAVGRFRGGTLKLSKNDVLDIRGSGQIGKSRKRGRR
ncbi:hypothetical protein LTR84_001073 [Exophiala bonariae]|uniref:Protein FAF1 n=1 Tax=Exophiala bonariae TaxID=1690606 RepID=A0AAV9NWC0_9EURO|nr:hypothetical protein LTR84_001073 [Exophiala bonariae]